MEEKMKSKSKIGFLMSAIAVTAMMATTPVFATDAKNPDSKNYQVNTDNKNHKMKKDTKNYQMKHDNSMAELGPIKGGYSILGTKFIGKEIENLQGEDVGEVKDIMIDSNGRVRYAAVSYGGFLGIGDKLFAVPMEAFQFQRESDLFFDDVKLILDVTPEQLEGDEGFDEKNWPDLADENYRKELDTRYNIDRPRMNN